MVSRLVSSLSVCLGLVFVAPTSAAYDPTDVRINFQSGPSVDMPAPKGYLAVGDEPYSKERGYGWIGEFGGGGWHLESSYVGGQKDAILASGVFNTHAPTNQCVAFRIDVPNGEYILELGFGGVIYDSMWDIHVAGRRVTQGKGQPGILSRFKMNVYVAHGYFVFGMSKTGVNYLHLKRISDRVPEMMSSKQILDFAPEELISDAQWKAYFQKPDEGRPPMDWELLEAEIHQTRRQAEEAEVHLPIEYWTEVPLTLRWGDAGAKVDVRRRLPFPLDDLVEMDIRVRLSRPSHGKVSCRIGKFGKTLAAESDGYGARFRITDRDLLKYIAERRTDFGLHIDAGTGSVGKFLYDTPAPVAWIPDGRDGDDAIVAVTYQAKCRSADPRFADNMKVAYDLPQARKALPPARETVALREGQADLSGPRAELCLNGEWDFQAVDTPGIVGRAEEAPKDGWGKLRVPGTWSGIRRKSRESECHDVSEWTHKPCGWYRTTFVVPDDWKGRRISLDFDMIHWYGAVTLNGRFLGVHNAGPYRPFEIDVTDAVRFGRPNEMYVFVEDENRKHEPLDCAERIRRDVGILRDVFLRAQPAVRVENVLVTPSVRKKTLEVRSRLVNESSTPVTVEVRSDVRDAGKTVLSLPPKRVTVPAGKTVPVSQSAPWPDPILWDIDQPHLYFLRTALDGPGGDILFTRFGFREFWIEDMHFMLNGRRIHLQGDSTLKYYHVFTYPYARLALAAARLANRNILRLQHPGGQDPFPEIGDEMGMLLMPENVGGIPPDQDVPVDATGRRPQAGWDREIRRNLESFYNRAWNHPSIVVQSMDNELQVQGGPRTWMSDELVKLEAFSKTIDPTRVYTHEGDFWLKDDFQTDTINMHYVPLSWISGWREKYKRPLMLGEINGDPNPLAGTFYAGDRAAWGREMRKLTTFLTGYLQSCIDLDVPGIHLCYAVGATRCPIYRAGPWGNLDQRVLVPNPSLSGPGIKLYSLGRAYFMGNYNWFDPSVPKYVPDPSYHAVADVLRPQPYFRFTLPPEIIVQGLPHENIFLVPAEGQNCPVVGVQADAEGKAWFHLKEFGRYRAVVTRNGRTLCADVHPQSSGEWGQVMQVTLKE